MDPLVLATTVVNLLVPYLLEAIAGKTVDEAWKKVEALFTAVKKKFAGNVYAEETLKRVNDKPQSQSRQAALVGVLEEQIQKDSDFGEMLQKLLGEAKNAGIETIIQNVKIGGNARTGHITTIGKVDGSVDLSKRK